MVGIRAGGQRSQSDGTPPTAQAQWSSNRPTGMWEDNVQVSILPEKIRKTLSCANS